jgi:nicotinamidase-related amidase
VNGRDTGETAGAVKAKDGLPAWIAPERAAVLVIDMQTDFASEKGALGGLVDLSAVGPALLAAERLTEAARAAGAPVVFIGLETQPETDSPAWRERMRRMGGDADAESGLCRKDSPGAAFVGPKPLAHEVQLFKTRYSGFHNTRLHEVLTALGVDTVVVCGLTTECCVDCTVRDAFHLDYHVFLVSDACAAYSPALHDGALLSLEANCAMLITVEEAAKAWSQAHV